MFWIRNITVYYVFAETLPSLNYILQSRFQREAITHGHNYLYDELRQLPHDSVYRRPSGRVHRHLPGLTQYICEHALILRPNFCGRYTSLV